MKNNRVVKSDKEKIKQLIDDMAGDISDGEEAKEAKEAIINYIVQLCVEYYECFENGESIAIEMLDELDQMVGDRKKYNDAYRQYKKNLNNQDCEKRKRQLYQDYQKWEPAKGKKKNPYSFFSSITKKYTDSGKDEYNDYFLCRNTVLAVLKEPKNVEIEIKHGYEFPFLREYDVTRLKMFAYYLSIAFLNRELTETLAMYIDDVKKNVEQHCAKEKRSKHRLLSDGLPKDEIKEKTKGRISNDEVVWQLIWGKCME